MGQTECECVSEYFFNFLMLKVQTLTIFMLLLHSSISYYYKSALECFDFRLCRDFNKLNRMLSGIPLYSQKEATDYPNFSFSLKTQDKKTKARTGLLCTPNGKVETPNFVFCATKAAMKSITPDQLRSEGSQICLSNTYHLMLAPGADVIEKMGGLQKFTAWHGPMRTMT